MVTVGVMLVGGYVVALAFENRKNNYREILKMKKTINNLLLISSGGLAVAGLIFIIISMFEDNKTICLPTGLFCVVLSNLFNIIRTIGVKQNNKF